MDTHNSKGKVAPRWSNLQAIGESWMQGAGTPLLVIHRAKTMVRIINLVRMIGHGANALEAGSGNDALAYSDAMSRDLSNRMTAAAVEGSSINVTGWDTGLPSPETVRAEITRLRPVPIPPPPVLSEQPVTMGGN